MEVVVPVQDFHFDSTCTTPYASAPSSPRGLGGPFNYYYHYTSAPTSPTRAAEVYAEFSSTNNLRLSPSSASPAISYNWDDDKPTNPQLIPDDDFAFDFSGQLDKGGMPPPLTTADQLFEKGRIRPLKPPPRLRCLDNCSSAALLPVSPKPRHLRSPRHKSSTESQDFDPFTAAMVEVTRDRGRERMPLPPSISSSRSRKGSRSLSPLRRGVGAFEKASNSSPAPSLTSLPSTAPLKSGGSKKWRLRDLLLFRSASEGRATGAKSKDPLRKYTLLSTSASSMLPSSPSSLISKRGAGGEDSRNSSFRSVDSGGSISRRSPHEKHYTANRAAAEGLKKKTPLPYRQGLFSCLRFNPAMRSLSKGFDNSYSMNR